MTLTMQHFLDAVAEHGLSARDVLLDEGHHPKVILRKAEKAGGKGYTEFGSTPDLCWLTDKGRAFLASGG